MEEQNSNTYITLQEAVKYCSYSQEYLSLRARQGKLKALKFGRNWITKKEWLEEYLKKAEEYNNGLNHKPKEEALRMFERVLELNPGNQDVIAKIEVLKK